MSQTLPSLYDHQAEMIGNLRQSIARCGRSILCANPGVGKTRMAKWMLGNSLNREPLDGWSGAAVFCVHRRGLVDNACQSFDEGPRLKHGVIMSGRETDWSKRIQVGSIDTMKSWYLTDDGYNSGHTFDLVVFDECHSHLGKLRTWLESHEAKRQALGLRPAVLIGLSATPECKGLSDVFREIVTGPSTDWLIENGFLSPFKYYQATQGKLGLLVKKGDEFTSDSVDAAMGHLAGDLVRDWKRFAEGRPTVGFFKLLKHAEAAQAELQAAGVRAEYVDGETPDDERRQLFEHLDAGRIDYICNVGIVERGTNIPAIGCIQLCTAIGGFVRYKQIVGRGSRVSPDKTDCLVLDHGGNVKRLGFFEDEVDWVLDNTRKASKEHEPRAAITCPQCDRVYRGGACNVCGYEPTAKERKSQGLEFDGRELVEVSRKKSSEEGRKQTCEELMIRALYMAGKTRRTFKQAMGIAYGLAEKQGTRFKVPRRVVVAGREWNMVPYGHPDGNRRVSELYEFTVR